MTPRTVPLDRADVLHRLRTATAADHERVESALGLMDPGLDRARLVRAMTALHGFWSVAERDLDRWAERDSAAAADVDWAARRRAHRYAADLAALGAPPADRSPELPPVDGTDAALGRMYVLEGATLGGRFIDRHLTGLPSMAGVRLRAFSPYGERTGEMWHAFRRAARARVAAGGDAGRIVSAAGTTFAVLAEWCTARTDVAPSA
jgi:heme oxygenase (biliverdin-IX-beta and delta-forming)